MRYIVQVTSCTVGFTRATASNSTRYENYRVLELSEAKQLHGPAVNSEVKLPSPNIKGGLAERPPNSAVGFTGGTASDSSGDGRKSGNSWNPSDWANRHSNEETVPPSEVGIYRTFPCVHLRLVRSSNANETGRYRTNSLPKFSLKDT